MLRFGLASDGVYMCPVCYHPGGSLLHCPSTLTDIPAGGTFLLHFPWSRLHRMLSGILPCEARTFLVHFLPEGRLRPRPFILLRTLRQHGCRPHCTSYCSVPCLSSTFFVIRKSRGASHGDRSRGPKATGPVPMARPLGFPGPLHVEAAPADEFTQQ